MIDSRINKNNCVGCEACVQICPHNAISSVRDNEGFLYPQVDTDKCVECGLCLKKCPALNPQNERNPISVNWAYNKNSVYKESSSSGGLFVSFAEQFINSGGYVCGASFDENWSVEHHIVNNISDLDKLKRSKYVQSRIGTCYNDIHDLLRKNDKVLFCGTPCEVSGLLSFLGKKYDNLTTIEIVCHGSPSPLVWSNYLQTVCPLNEISAINFRDKTRGWSEYSVVVRGNDGRDILNQSRFGNIFIQGFLKDLYLRPSCYSCQNKNFRSGADLTIGDFWGVANTSVRHDGMGVSLCYINTKKGNALFQDVKCQFVCGELSLDEVTRARIFKGAVSSSANIPAVRAQFWLEYNSAEFCDKNIVIRKYARDAFMVRMKRRVRNILPSFVVNLMKKIR